MDDQADLSVCLAHMPFCWICHEETQVCNNVTGVIPSWIKMALFGCCNDPKFLDSHVRANSADPDQTAPSSFYTIFIPVNVLEMLQFTSPRNAVLETRFGFGCP